MHSATPPASVSSMHSSCRCAPPWPGQTCWRPSCCSNSRGVPCWPPHGTPRCCTKQPSNVTREDLRKLCSGQPPRSVLGSGGLQLVQQQACQVSHMQVVVLHRCLQTILQAFSPGWLRAWSPAQDVMTCIFSTLLLWHQQCNPVKLAETTAPAVLSSPRELSQANCSSAECPGALQLF